MAYFVTAYNKRNAYQKIAESLLSRVILKKVVQPGLAPSCYLSGYHFFFDRDEILEEILPCISGEEEERVQIADKLIVDIRDKAESRDLVCECVDLLVATRKGELEARKATASLAFKLLMKTKRTLGVEAEEVHDIDQRMSSILYANFKRDSLN